MIIHRRAFTLIELLVVIAIIAVLIAHPSPRRAGGPRSRATCPVCQQPEAVRARIEQLRKCVRSLSLWARGGLHDFASERPVYARWSANSQLLAYMEQSTVSNAINFSLPPETPDPGALGMMMGMGMLMPYQDPNRANSTVFSVSISFFLCPSDSAPRRAPATVMWATTTIRTRGAG